MPGPHLPHFVLLSSLLTSLPGPCGSVLALEHFSLDLEQSLDCFILTVRLSAPQASCLGPSNLLEGADCLGYHRAQGLEGVQRQHSDVGARKGSKQHPPEKNQTSAPMTSRNKEVFKPEVAFKHDLKRASKVIKVKMILTSKRTMFTTVEQYQVYKSS